MGISVFCFLTLIWHSF